MFSELVESVVRPRDKRKRWALAGSLALQAVCLLILIVVPLIYTQALPKAILNTELVALPGAASKPVAAAPAVRGGPRSVRLLNHDVLFAITRFPAHARIFEEAPFPPEVSVSEGPMNGSSELNLLNDFLNGAPNSAQTVSRPPTPPSVPQRVPVMSTIEAAKLISRIQPVYPPLAIQARIQGNVVLHAIIAKEGGVSELQVLSGHPLLVNAALAAVRQWRYSPTLLNGQAVEVETTITVSFVLGQ
jgi:periplasmic protein TonB